ncbi:MAG: hypothetical protein ACLUJG_08430 [Lawsonibacter sp.]
MSWSPGSTAQLKQYYYVGEYTYNEKKAGFTVRPAGRRQCHL